jgi:hypothetical protein
LLLIHTLIFTKSTAFDRRLVEAIGPCAQYRAAQAQDQGKHQREALNRRQDCNDDRVVLVPLNPRLLQVKLQNLSQSQIQNPGQS